MSAAEPCGASSTEGTPRSQGWRAALARGMRRAGSGLKMRASRSCASSDSATSPGR
jgi:hypothetical protein